MRSGGPFVVSFLRTPLAVMLGMMSGSGVAACSDWQDQTWLPWDVEFKYS